MSIKIAICDDEKLQTEYLHSLIEKWSKSNAKEAEVEVFYSAEAFYFNWCEDKSFDVLLLDIQMSGQNGVDLAKEIRKSDDNLCIIFITGLSEYIDEGYEVSALHYLVKPVREDKLFACLDKACKRVVRQQKSILVSRGSENIRIMQEDIHYVEAFAHSVNIRTAKTGIEVKKCIGELAKELDGQLFIRCHRSYIVNLKYIHKISKTDLELDSGKVIPVSRRLYNDTNKAFISFYRGEKQ